MIKKFLYPLYKYFTGFNVFQYVTFRAAYALVTALLISLVLGPWIIKKLKKWKIGQRIRHDGPPTHLTKSGTPTMGGVLLLLAVVVSIILWQDIDIQFTWILLLALLGFGIIGFVDDYLKITRKSAVGLRAELKWIAQVGLSIAIAILLYSMGSKEVPLLYLPFLKEHIANLGLFFIPFAVLVLLGASNAVNITDGLDGLATGLILMVAIAFSVLAFVTDNIELSAHLNIPFVQNSGELSVASLALVGACLGFLWFNAHPAEIMMGDTGSLALGGMIGILALILKKEILLFIIGGVFVIETGSVIIQVLYYKCTKKRVFKMAPLHHHFELMGWKESKIVTRFWILGGLFAVLGLSTLKIQ